MTAYAVCRGKSRRLLWQLTPPAAPACAACCGNSRGLPRRLAQACCGGLRRVDDSHPLCVSFETLTTPGVRRPCRPGRCRRACPTSSGSSACAAARGGPTGAARAKVCRRRGTCPSHASLASRRRRNSSATAERAASRCSPPAIPGPTSGRQGYD